MAGVWQSVHNKHNVPSRIYLSWCLDIWWTTFSATVIASGPETFRGQTSDNRIEAAIKNLAVSRPPGNVTSFT